MTRIFDTLSKKYRVHKTFEPGGSLKFSIDMRKFIFDHINDNLSHMTELLLFQAVRTELYGKEVLPALLDEYIVLSDRCYISSLVYQGKCLLGDMQVVQDFLEATFVRYPDIVFFFDVDVETALTRMSDNDPFKQKGINYWKAAHAGYQEIFGKEQPFKTIRIDANQSADNVFEQLKHALINILPT